MVRRNPAFAALDAFEAPDGDADLEGVMFDSFDVPACEACGSLLKPDVVFFGENVPRNRVEQAMAAIDVSDAMLVVGSSLMVYSGYRFVTAMAATGKPIAAINLGRTRGDDLFALKVVDCCAKTLSLVLDEVSGERRS
jgi:NAD-dependent SIR2 family protein deacetylase